MKTHPGLTRQARIEKIMQQRRADLALVLENLSEDQNISAILRTAESFGVGLVYIVYSKGKKPKLSKNTSSGATKWLNIKFYTSIATCINQLKTDGFKIVACVVDPSLPDLLWNTKFRRKMAIMVGNEAHGLSNRAQKLSDHKIYLPMYGLTESLNVSVAAAIFLYEVIRQKEIKQV